MTSEWLHFKNCWKSGPKVPTLRDQWFMAKGPLDQVVFSGNFITIITEDNQIFVYLQWKMKLLLIHHKREERYFAFLQQKHEMQWKGKFSS